MKSTEQPIKVAVIDDFLKPLNINDIYDEDIRELIFTSESDEQKYILDFCINNSIIPSTFDTSDHEEIEKLLTQEDIASKVFLSDAFREKAQDAQPNLCVEKESVVALEDSTVFENIFEAFPKELYVITKIYSRPKGKDLLEYDLVIMDLMMNDQYDSTDKLSKYIGETVKSIDSEKIPSFILMSSHTELDSNRSAIREIAKISSLGFSILKKSEIAQKSGSKKISLIWKQMNANKSASASLRDFYIKCEESLHSSWQDTVKQIWNIDAAYLQNIHRMTVKENYPFADHLFEIIGRHHLWSVENSISSEDSLTPLIKIFCEDGDNDLTAFQSYSKESSPAIHDLTAKNYFSGLSNHIPQKILKEACEAKTIVNGLPFGSLLIQGSTFPVEGPALIHCTQQCDLSRNIVKHDMSLIFLHAEILENQLVSNSESDDILILPLPINNNGSLWSAHINLKKVVAHPYNEMLDKLESENWHIVQRLRGEVIRQIRQESFHRLSRIEKSVPSNGDSLTVFATVWLRCGKGKSERVDYKDAEGNKIEIRLTQFKGYHFIGPDCLDFSIWLHTLCLEKGLNKVSDPGDIEKVLRENLKKIETFNSDLDGIKAVITTDEEKGSQNMATNSANLLLTIK